jgi:hypothetical protein
MGAHFCGGGLLSVVEAVGLTEALQNIVPPSDHQGIPPMDLLIA